MRRAPAKALELPRVQHRPTESRNRRNKKGQLRRTTVPPVQQLKTVQRYTDGQSLRRISREEHRDFRTVRKIVRAEEMEQYATELREKMLGQMGEKMLERIDWALQNPDVKDATLAGV